MRYQTDLMRKILTTQTAQRMIDYISPIYGNSYVGLWILQAQGTILDADYSLAKVLKSETNPATATLLLDQWEDHYKVERGVGLTDVQRRARILAKMQTRGACNPAKLAAAVSAALDGAEVEVTENVSKNKFRVTVLQEVESLAPAIKVIERMKPAHLIYDIVVEIRAVPTANIKVAVAMTYSEQFTLQTSEDVEDPQGAFVIGDLLIINDDGSSVDGDTLVLSEGAAEVVGDTLIIKKQEG